MVKKAISWALVGAFAYLWWWAGHRWVYLHTVGNQWTSVFELFTLISLAVLLRARQPAGPGFFDGLVATLRGFLPTLAWLLLAVLVLRLIAGFQGGELSVDNLVHAAVAVLVAGGSTALWFGSIVNAGDG